MLHVCVGENAGEEALRNAQRLDKKQALSSIMK